MSNEQPANQPKERLYSLQILRGLAAVGVLFFHVEQYTNILGGITNSLFNHVPYILGQGAFWFFEISGFIMAYLIDRNLNRNFLLERVIRIYPPYLLAVITAVFLYVSLLGSYTTPRRDFLLALTLLPVSDINYTLRIEWSLTYEVFFYIVCAVFTLGSLRKYYFPFLIAWFALIFAMQFQQSSLLLPIHKIPFSQLNYYFIFGGFIYYLNKHKTASSTKINLVISFISITLYCLLFYNRTHPLLQSKLSTTLLFGLTIAAFLYSIVQIKIAQPNVLVKLGDYSYGLYLMHASIIVITFTLWMQFIGRINTLAGFVALALALLCGWYSGRLDVALHHWIKSWPALQRILGTRS